MTRSTSRARLLAAIACLTVATGCAGTARQPDLGPGERRAFRASSMHTQFFIVGAFEGIAEVWRDSVLVLVSAGRIDMREHRGDDVVLRVALANGDTASRWRVGDASAAAPLSTIRGIVRAACRHAALLAQASVPAALRSMVGVRLRCSGRRPRARRTPGAAYRVCAQPARGISVRHREWVTRSPSVDRRT